MDRRQFFNTSLNFAGAVAAGAIGGPAANVQPAAPPGPGAVAPETCQSDIHAAGTTQLGTRLNTLHHPLAITMWDFSWLERRWPGAGYEDWDHALDSLVERGYDAVRIDAYPHFLAVDPNATWELIPAWSAQDWGSPAKNRVQVQPALNQFIRKCAQRKLRVGLSTWFRVDPVHTLMRIQTPEEIGRIWQVALDSISREGLLDSILYVDLCNEWPIEVWAPFLPKGFIRASGQNADWMRCAIHVVRSAYPQLDYTFSQTTEFDTWRQQDVSMLDFMEPHIWMAQAPGYYDEVGYNYERFDLSGYAKLVDNAKRVYMDRRGHWDAQLKARIEQCAEWSRAVSKPLITTECWGLVDYKDWPLLEWNWIKDLCEFGVHTAAATGRWAAIATSNFAGPQFAGMWRDVAWHRRMTDVIHASQITD
jgi:hypothetical protein